MHHPVSGPVFPVLAVLVAMLGAWTGLDLFRRVRANTGQARAVWLGSAAVAMGFSIWAMHFVAMLGFDPGSPVRYDSFLTLLSLALAIGATAVAFQMYDQARARLISAGVIMGLGICTMHYVGMAAMKSAAPMDYSVPLVVLSVVVAIAAATAALAAVSVESSTRWRLVAAPLLGLAIVSMHYIAMAALKMGPAAAMAGQTSTERGLEPALLAGVVAGGAGVLLTGALIAAVFDRRFQRLAITEARKREDQLRSILENLPMGIYVADARTGEIRLANAEAARIMRHPLGPEPLWANDRFGPIGEDDQPIKPESYALSEAMVHGGRVGPRFQRYRRGDGTIGVFEIQATGLPDETGQMTSAIAAFQDVTDKLLAEDALRRAQALAESETRFRQMAEVAPVMMWMSDRVGNYIYLNRALRDFWGVDNAEGFDWAATLVDIDAPQVVSTVKAAIERVESLMVEARYRRADGEIRTLSTEAQPRFEADGSFAGLIGVNVDVTETRRAAAHQQLLINELNHRVKNTLATVQSMAIQTLRAGSAGEAKDVLSARIVALASAHDVLTRENWESAELKDIVLGGLRAFEAFTDRIRVEGPSARVGPQAALAISMALHELGTNAVKYGALSVDAGHVDVAWRPATGDEPTIDLEWRERNGPPVSAPTRHGFGSRLLRRSLTADLGGHCLLRFEPDGVQCDVRLIVEPVL